MKLSTASARRARMAMPTELFSRVRLMVTVKAYPNISQRHGEVVCVAGIRTDQAQPAWVRLWPVQFRDLAFADRFEKVAIDLFQSPEIFSAINFAVGSSSVARRCFGSYFHVRVM